MVLNNVGFDHRHDADFFIHRPDGSGDWLLLLLKSDAIFTLNGDDVLVPKNSFFLYPKGMGQFYRCVPQSTFANDWIHFEFEDDEEALLLQKGIQYATPIPIDNIHFLSFLVKCLAYENCSDNLYKHDNIEHYMLLLLNKVSEQQRQPTEPLKGSKYEMLMTMRNKIYAEPYQQRTISWASHELRMSTVSFQRLYKKQFGVTFMQDLINSRMEYAKMLLIHTELNSKDIAEQCGYNHYAHFTRQFKSSVGLTPLEYRKVNQRPANE